MIELSSRVDRRAGHDRDRIRLDGEQTTSRCARSPRLRSETWGTQRSAELRYGPPALPSESAGS